MGADFLGTLLLLDEGFGRHHQEQEAGVGGGLEERSREQVERELLSLPKHDVAVGPGLDEPHEAINRLPDCRLGGDAREAWWGVAFKDEHAGSVGKHPLPLHRLEPAEAVLCHSAPWRAQAEVCTNAETSERDLQSREPLLARTLRVLRCRVAPSAKGNLLRLVD